MAKAGTNASPSGITHILLADDHAVVRSGIRLLLDAEPDLEVVGEAKDGLEAVALTEQLQPHVVVMDISMPKLNGIAATRRIHNLFPTIGVIALTMHDNDAYFYEILRAGGSGYILKDAAAEELVKGIRAAAAGDAYLSASVAGHVLNDYIQRAAQGDSRDRLALVKYAIRKGLISLEPDQEVGAVLPSKN